MSIAKWKSARFLSVLRRPRAKSLLHVLEQRPGLEEPRARNEPGRVVDLLARERAAREPAVVCHFESQRALPAERERDVGPLAVDALEVALRDVALDGALHLPHDPRSRSRRATMWFEV